MILIVFVKVYLIEFYENNEVYWELMYEEKLIIKRINILKWIILFRK